MSISFIVPVYNTEINYLKRCVFSIEKLKISNYEVIIINDGSNDGNTKKYKDFLRGRKNIVYLENENKGVSYSRNCGIEKASKEYVTFVDSDDTIDFNSFNKGFIEYDEDIVILLLRNKSTDKKTNYSFRPGLVPRSVLLKDAIVTCNFCSSCAKLFKRDFLISNKIFFNESFVQGEDALFNLCCLEFNPTIRYYDVVFYEYDYGDLHTEDRWRNNFEKCLDNKYYIYSKKQEMIRNLCPPNDRMGLLAGNDNEFVKSLFHSYKFLITINDDNKTRLYVNRLKRIKINKKDLGLKERLYYDLLLHDNSFIRKIIGLMLRVKNNPKRAVLAI